MEAKEVDALSLEKTLVTSRLEVRPPRELDRARFVELFCDHDFMIFSGQARTEEAAQGRFDHMLAMCEVVPFAKQPIVERASGVLVGYTGVDCFTFEGEERLEWDTGWCLSREVWGTQPRQAKLYLPALVRRFRANFWR
jgi:RimJ/RimL family protein N-acetyltransferase